ncbi:M24 family metallopeptidase, partial [Candidatus Micrarchaeota archaeon]|nr:M24 family metallopeptidase [Candidatus Micrarchaeota archaeon]
HIDGYVADCAFTLDFSGEHGKLVEASAAALETAVSMAKPGINVREIGKAIQGEITKRGFKPISNLSGHRVDKFHQHAGDNIPNVESGNYVLQEGDSFAIEPFATNGFGQVVDGPETEIFLATGIPPRARLPSSRKIAQFIADNYELPFARRWLHAEFSDFQHFSINAAIKELESLGVISPYPVLVEKNKGIVSQAETTIILTGGGCKAIVPVPK